MQITLTEEQLKQIWAYNEQNLLKAVSVDDFLIGTAEALRYGDKVLSKAEKDEFVSQAKVILSTKLWGIIVNEMRGAAYKKMFEKSEGWEDMTYGKALLYTLEVMEKKLDTLSKM